MSIARASRRGLLAVALANPGTLNIASGGVATSTHLMIELLQMRSGARVTHVPYRGTGAAIQDLLGGQVQAMIQAMAHEAVASRLGSLGLERLQLGPAAFRDMLTRETARWREMVQTAGIRPE